MSPHELSGQDVDGENVGPRNPQNGACLKRYDDDELHDLICVGFGPASLAIAVALHDALERGDRTLRTHKPKVRFLERQAEFAWHAGMLLPGSKMQISFIKDLACLRNPRSKFTFLNYLHEKGRLVSFTNLGTFLPQRLEYEDYMRWCADHFAEVVDYNQNVEMLAAGQTDPNTGVVQCFYVRSSDKCGRTWARRAKHVVVAVGGRPNIPTYLDIAHPRVIHSSDYATSITDIFLSGNQPKSVAIIGAGQSAAEIFHNIPSRFPNAKSYLLIRGSALRPSDDSPFVNEIFDPSRVDDVYSQKPNVRAEGIAVDKATNYGVVRVELLENIYSTLYSYRIQSESEDQWPQRILTHCAVTGMRSLPSDSEHAVRLYIQDDSRSFKAHKSSKTECLDVDLVVVASGYRRDAHEDILKYIKHLMTDGEDDNGASYGVGRDYRVHFKNGSVEPDAGIWLQGCNESTHGLSDTLLSILSTRGGEMVNSIFGSTAADSESTSA